MLQPTKLKGRVEAILVNRNRDESLASEKVDSVNVTYKGFDGEAHGGLTRKSCVRVKLQYPEGTEIRNTRQLTVVSKEELEQIAEKMDIPHINPEWIGANLVLSGIPSLTLLPPASRLIFERGCSLVVDLENGPCKYPGEIIDSHFPDRKLSFPMAAQHLRGFTGWVEKIGTITQGETLTVHLPSQAAYPHSI